MTSHGHAADSTAAPEIRSPQRAVILTWFITSIAMITVAVILSRGGPAPCPQAFGICAG